MKESRDVQIPSDFSYVCLFNYFHKSYHFFAFPLSISITFFHSLSRCVYSDEPLCVLLRCALARLKQIS